MRVITCQNGQLQTLSSEVAALAGRAGASGARPGFTTGLEALDTLAPGASFARGAVHELLYHPHHPAPRFFAALLARTVSLKDGVHRGGVEGAERQTNDLATDGAPMNTDTTSHFPSSVFIGAPSVATPSSSLRALRAFAVEQGRRTAVVWCDPGDGGGIYPPALAALGFDLEWLYLLRTPDVGGEAWAVAECLRCRGVGAVVAAPGGRVSRVVARKLQLAAERGGGVGLLLRTTGPGSDVYAAATRWLVEPMPGERTVQRWKVRLVHGHGGRVGEAVVLEHHRDSDSEHLRVEAHPLRPAAQLADRPAAAHATSARRTA